MIQLTSSCRSRTRTSGITARSGDSRGCTARTGRRQTSVLDFVGDLQGIEAVYDQESACREFDLPPDREGDVVVVSNANTAIGRSEAEHDLSELQGYRLRSHGGLAERYVPIILSEPLTADYARRATQGTINSYEIFDYAINGV